MVIQMMPPSTTTKTKTATQNTGMKRSFSFSAYGPLGWSVSCVASGAQAPNSRSRPMAAAAQSNLFRTVPSVSRSSSGSDGLGEPARTVSPGSRPT